MIRAARIRLAAGAGVALVAALTLILLVGRGRDQPGAPRSGAVLSAAAFADSVGVNVHLSYTDAAYGNGPVIRRRLQELGVRHVRDGLELGRPDQWQRFAELAAVGVRSTLILGAPGRPIPEYLRALEGPLQGAVEAVESPNEFDGPGGPAWASALRAYDGQLRRSLTADPALRRLPLVGPSLIRRESHGELGDVSGDLDFGNLHSYPGGHAPETNLEPELALARKNAADKPVVVTETGYHNALKSTEGQPAVSEQAAADYLPRLLLASFAAGIRRTFLYELADPAPDPALGRADAHFGLLRSDLTPKPAFAAVHNLLALCSGTAPTEPVTGYAPTVGDTSGDVQQLVLAAGGGRHLIALWRRVDLSPGVAERSVRVRLPDAAGSVEVHRPSRGAAPVSVRRNVRELDVSLSGDAVVLVVAPA